MDVKLFDLECVIAYSNMCCNQSSSGSKWARGIVLTEFGIDMFAVEYATFLGMPTGLKVGFSCAILTRIECWGFYRPI